MILELDCGNSFFKWRLVDPQQQEATGPVERCASLEELLLALPPYGQVARCRLVGVRGGEETQRLVEALERRFQRSVSVATVSTELAGVINGYASPLRLGVDRWLALVAAYNLCRSACIVFDLGTALTVDLVSDGGAHQGGFIVPGLGLLRQRLLEQTREVRFDNDSEVLAKQPGRDTTQAVHRGCRLMIMSFVQEQIEHARETFGSDVAVYATGGDCEVVRGISGLTIVPDLVFRGLAYACP